MRKEAMRDIDATAFAPHALEGGWYSSKKPTGEFRPHFRPPTTEGELSEMVCVDEKGRVVLGVQSVSYRPTIADQVFVPKLAEQRD